MVSLATKLYIIWSVVIGSIFILECSNGHVDFLYLTQWGLLLQTVTVILLTIPYTRIRSELWLYPIAITVSTTVAITVSILTAVSNDLIEKYEKEYGKGLTWAYNAIVHYIPPILWWIHLKWFYSKITSDNKNYTTMTSSSTSLWMYSIVLTIPCVYYAYVNASFQYKVIGDDETILIVVCLLSSFVIMTIVRHVQIEMKFIDNITMDLLVYSLIMISRLGQAILSYYIWRQQLQMNSDLKTIFYFTVIWASITLIIACFGILLFIKYDLPVPLSTFGYTISFELVYIIVSRSYSTDLLLTGIHTVRIFSTVIDFGHFVPLLLKEKDYKF